MIKQHSSAYLGAPGQPELNLADDLVLEPSGRHEFERDWGPPLSVILKREGLPLEPGTRFEVLREETAPTDGGGPGVRYREIGRATVIHAGRLTLPAAPQGWYVLRDSTPVVMRQRDSAVERGANPRFEHTGAECTLELSP